MACTDTENSPQPGDTENVLLRKLLNRLCNVTSGGGGGVSQAYVDARDAATLASANANAVAGDVATLAAAMSSASALYVLKSGDTMTGALLLPGGAVGAPALSRSGDTNTGLWYPAADTIAFSTAGAERVRILSTGEVGIGTAVPDGFLDVRGTGAVRIVSSSPISQGRVLLLTNTQAAAANVQTSMGFAGDVSGTGMATFVAAWDGAATTDAYWAIQTRGSNTLTEKFRITSAGNVGIGITNPLAKLHITPAASGTDYFRIDHSDGTPRLQVGVLPASAVYAGLWLSDIIPANENYSIICNGTLSSFNGPTDAYLGTGNGLQWHINASGHFLAGTDNTYDIGASGANRPQDVHVARTVDTLNLTLRTAGLFSVTSGANQRAGNAVLVGGTVTVSNTTVTANTIVLLTRKTSGGTLGTAITYTVTAATSFTIDSDSVLDTSTFSYFLIEVP